MSFTKKTGGCAVLVFTLLLFSATAEEGAVEQNIITLTSEDAVQRAVKENISLKQKAITLNVQNVHQPIHGMERVRLFLLLQGIQRQMLQMTVPCM